MKRLFVLLLVALMVPACGDNSQKRIKLAVVGRAETPYWESVKMGAEAAGEVLGVSVEFLAPSKEDPAWQIKKIEELTESKVDGLAFAASDPKSIVPVVMKAMQANIPCVALDTDVANSRHLYIGTGNYYAGEEAGNRIVTSLNGKGKVAIIGNSSENTDLLQRVMGFRDTLAEYIGLNIIETINEENGAIRASDVESLLASHPDMDGLFCVSDASGIVASEAVKKANKVGLAKIVCIGESDEIMMLVRDGVIQTAVVRRPYRTGYLAVLALYNMVRVGIENALMIMPETKMVKIGTVIITPQNIAQYREYLKELGIKVRF